MKLKLPLLLFGLLMTGSAPTFAAVTNTVVMGNYFFNPTNLTINVGDAIRWTNSAWQTIPHDAKATNNPAFLWDTGDLDNSPTTYLLTFPTAGNFPYYCERHVYATLPQNRHPEQTGTVTVVSISLPPSVSLTNPANNSRLIAPATILLQATATDDGAVTNVQFFSEGALLGADTAAPYAFTLSNAAAGNYAFTAQARDNVGLSTTSTVVNVQVLTNALLSAPALLPNGQSWLSVQGVAGQTYALDGSTNLADWAGILTNVAPANTFNVTDATATNVLRRFYRTRQDW